MNLKPVKNQTSQYEEWAREKVKKAISPTWRTGLYGAKMVNLISSSTICASATSWATNGRIWWQHSILNCIGTRLSIRRETFHWKVSFLSLILTSIIHAPYLAQALKHN